MKIIDTKILAIVLISLQGMRVCNYAADPAQLDDWTIGASSRFPSPGLNSYGPENLLFGLKTAWVEGVATDSKFSDTAISGISLDLEEFNYSPELETTRSIKRVKASPSVSGIAFKTFSNSATGKAPTAKQILKLIIGQWDGGRHITEYRKDGTFLLDPEPGDDPVGVWSVKGNVLIKKFGSEKPERTTVLSITEEEMVIRSSSGKEYVIRKVKKN